MNIGNYAQDQVWHAARSESARSSKRLIIGAIIVGLVSAGLAGFFAGHAPVAGLQGELAGARAQLEAEIVAVNQLRWGDSHCRVGQSDATRVEQLVAQGEYREASAIAALALSSSPHPICPGSGLAIAWYTASVDALFSTPVANPLDNSPVLAWRGIEQRAIGLGLTDAQRLSPMTVFAYAYNNRVWQLARAAFIAAFKQQLVTTHDLLAVNKYYAVLRNEGHILAFQLGGSDVKPGVQLLATADAISRLAGLGNGEARADLMALIGPAASGRVQGDNSDPVLAALNASVSR